MQLETRGRACSYDRRRFIATTGALGLGLLLPGRSEAGTLHRLAGTVTINGKRAAAGSRVNPGDRVITGPDALAVFAVGKDAFLLRADSGVELYASSKVKKGVVSGLRVLTGALLAVFGPGPKDVLTPTATAGIRGTGIYIEASPERTYFCTCYGEVRLADQHRSESKLVVATHHRANFIYAAPTGGRTMAPAEMINHTDDELVLLEKLVGRKPPFAE